MNKECDDVVEYVATSVQDLLGDGESVEEGCTDGSGAVGSVHQPSLARRDHSRVRCALLHALDDGDAAVGSQRPDVRFLEPIQRGAGEHEVAWHREHVRGLIEFCAAMKQIKPY